MKQNPQILYEGRLVIKLDLELLRIVFDNLIWFNRFQNENAEDIEDLLKQTTFSMHEHSIQDEGQADFYEEAMHEQGQDVSID